MRGMNPIDVYKLQVEGYNELTAYKDAERELAILTDKIKAGLSKDVAKQRRLQEQLDTSSVKDLVDAGLFQAIVEDVNLDDIEHKNAIARQVDDQVQKAPKWIRTGTNWAFMTQRSPMFKMMMQATQYSDFVARYAMMATLKETYRKEGMSESDAHEKALNIAIDTFINYELPDSKIISYANKMGFVMFTKYFIGIQNAIRNTGKGNPLHMALAILGQSALGIDLEDPTDASIINKNYSGLLHFAPVMDAATELLNPSLAQVAGVSIFGK